MTKICIYSFKGSAGKTPLAVEFALSWGWHVATNEDYSMLDQVIPEDFLIEVEAKKRFPDFHEDANVIFDLGGFVSNAKQSVLSAVEQSDVIVVPIYYERKAIFRGIATILEVREVNPNIVVVVTKLTKRKDEVIPEGDWRRSLNYQAIKDRIEEHTGQEYPMFPLKFSKAYEDIFDHEASIESICEQDPLLRYSYRDVRDQLTNLKSYLRDTYGT